MSRPALSTTPGIRMDPVTFEVLKNAFLNVTEEMAFALRRAAYSTNIKTRADFSCAFFDKQLRCIAQSFSEPPHPRIAQARCPHGRYGIWAGQPGPRRYAHCQ